METCKICKQEGNNSTAFKNTMGLSIHLRRKHGMSFEEYTDIYKQEKPVEKVEEVEEEIQPKVEIEGQKDVDEPVVKKVEIEPMKEIDAPESIKPESNGLPKITDYSLLSSDNFVAMFRFENTGNETYKKIIGIGSVIEEKKNTVSALVIGDDGLIIPVFMIPEFVGVVEIKSKVFAKAVKSGWVKQKKTGKKKVKRVSSRSGLFTRKRKSIPQNVTNEELVEGFSKILARRKK